MSLANADGQSFDLGRFTGPPRLVVASEVLDETMGLDQRKAIWRSLGLLPALTVVAGLFADLDLAAITDGRAKVEQAFIGGQVGALEPPLVAELRKRRTIFSNVGLVQCIKEIIEFADEASENELSALDLTRCVLSVNQENDKPLDPGLLARAANPGAYDAETLKADFLELALDIVAQQLFDYSEPFETLACTVDETWRRGWAPGTKQKVIQDLGMGPADVFAQVVGVDLDDFLVLGVGVLERGKKRGPSRLSSGPAGPSGTE